MSMHIPGYDLLERLGGGPMTLVFMARDLAKDELCALKTLNPAWDDQVTAAKLLQREARVGLAVRHPRLPSIRTANVLKPPFFLAMDLLDGQSLRDRLRRDYRLPVGEAVWLARQIAEGIQVLHAHGFIHGDVKPDNIQMTSDGRVLLLDLGFAHRPGENLQVLESGCFLGTADYIAPELCRKSPADCFGNDVFSLGVLWYEMLTGRLPYPRGDAATVIAQRGRFKPSPIADHRPSLPDSVATLVMRLLEPEPRRRPKLGSLIQQLIAVEIALLRKGVAA